jgi:hypothetical protein
LVVCAACCVVDLVVRAVGRDMYAGYPAVMCEVN